MSEADATGFGRRLRQERERRKISLTTIATTTKISVALLEALERDDLSRWPSGIFRRSFVRAYAQAIGLDGDAIVRECLERFPDPEELPFVAEPAPPPAPALKAGAMPMLRVRVVDAVSAFRRGELLVAPRHRWAAVACDVGVLLAIALVVFIIVGRFWESLGVLAFGYYGGGILFLGNTPGVCLFAPDSTERH